MRIAITGAQGQLGQALVAQLGAAALPLARHELDISQRAAVLQVLTRLRPHMVINTAAYTAVDRAETEAAACEAVNVSGVSFLAEACAEMNACLVHVSTDYVFGGNHSRRVPYCEHDTPAPLSEYGRSKLAGEGAAGACAQHLIVRTCGLYGAPIPRASFVETMLRLGCERGRVRVVQDQYCTPSYVLHVAEGIANLIHAEARGIFHVTNSGSTNWYEFAQAIFQLAGLSVAVEPISTAEYASPTQRPAYSVLSNSKYESLIGGALPPWRSGLAACLAKRLARPTPPAP